MEIQACPKCSSSIKVYSKLITFDIGRQHFRGDAYYVEDKVKFFESEHVHGDFINALFCRGCEIGFIPNSLLADLGIRDSGAVSSHLPPRQFGCIGHLDSRETNLYHAIIWDKEDSITRASINAKSPNKAKSELDEMFPGCSMSIWNNEQAERPR